MGVQSQGLLSRLSRLAPRIAVRCPHTVISAGRCLRVLSAHRLPHTNPHLWCPPVLGMSLAWLSAELHQQWIQGSPVTAAAAGSQRYYAGGGWARHQHYHAPAAAVALQPLLLVLILLVAWRSLLRWQRKHLEATATDSMLFRGGDSMAFGGGNTRRRWIVSCSLPQRERGIGGGWCACHCQQFHFRCVSRGVDAM